MNRRLPKWCSEFTDRHGRPRVRFRRTGQKTYYFRSVPWTSAFMAEYQACLDRTIAPKLEPGLRRTMQGTFSALIALYYRSPEFTGLAPGSTPGYRSSIERFRIAHGDKRVVLMGRRHIKVILGGMSSTPGAANNLYDRLRTLMALAVEEGFRRDNPMLGMKAPFRIKSEGYHTWTEEEIAHFEARPSNRFDGTARNGAYAVHRSAALRRRHYRVAACNPRPDQSPPAKDDQAAGNPCPFRAVESPRGRSEGQSHAASRSRQQASATGSANAATKRD